MCANHMTVGAHYVALRNFGIKSGSAETASGAGSEIVPLVCQVVELHHVVRVPVATIGTRPVLRRPYSGQRLLLRPLYCSPVLLRVTRPVLSAVFTTGGSARIAATPVPRVFGRSTMTHLESATHLRPSAEEWDILAALTRAATCTGLFYLPIAPLSFLWVRQIECCHRARLERVANRLTEPHKPC